MFSTMHPFNGVIWYNFLRMQGETLKVNTQLPSCGSWRLEREIGHGAYGVVYLAFSPDGEPAAVKVCRRDAVDPERYSRELRGAKLYCAVPQKEGLVRMRAFAETEWGFYAVMDLADDEFGRIEVPIESYRPKTLASVIKGEKALPLKECVNLAIFLARGLAALQLHHLLHRDIKPANVLYVCGRPVLSDPGLVVDESEAASFVGTPGYVPPEKFTDAASDVYSLGLTLKAASFGRQIEDIDKGPAMEADTGAKFFPHDVKADRKCAEQIVFFGIERLVKIALCDLFREKLQPAKRSDDIPVGVYGVDQADRGECDHCNQEKRDQAEAGFIIFGFIRIRENQRAEERAVLCDGNTEAALTDRLFW